MGVMLPFENGVKLSVYKPWSLCKYDTRLHIKCTRGPMKCSMDRAVDWVYRLGYVSPYSVCVPVAKNDTREDV
eukprot:scaffold44868_cov59-Attheya_sp.AAC.3